jgi:hypothetical protein
MDNISDKRINPRTGQKGEGKRLKKKYRYNDSLGKYKNKYQNLIHKPKNETNQNKFEDALTNLKSGLAENSQEVEVKEKIREHMPVRKHNLINTHKLSISVPKYHILRPSTPKRDYNLIKRKVLLNTPKTLNNSSYFKTSDNFAPFTETDISNKYNSTMRHKYRNFSRPNFRPLLTTTDFNLSSKYNINNIGDSSRNKELITLNNILVKQNKELRQKTREMRYKINDLLNNVKIVRIDNQKVSNEKKKLLMQIQNLENQLDNNKSMSLNELESKSNLITNKKI